MNRRTQGLMWLFASALGLALSSASQAQTGGSSTGKTPPTKQATGTPPPTTTTPGGTGTPTTGGFGQLTEEQDAALMAEATQLVDLVLTIFQFALSDEETAAVIEMVYNVLRFLTMFSQPGGTGGQ